MVCEGGIMIFSKHYTRLTSFSGGSLVHAHASVGQVRAICKAGWGERPVASMDALPHGSREATGEGERCVLRSVTTITHLLLIAPLLAYALLSAACPGEPYDAFTGRTVAKWRSPISAPATLVAPLHVKLDRTWLTALQRATQGFFFFSSECVMLSFLYNFFFFFGTGIDVKSSGFLQRSLLGYQRFLYLTAKLPNTLQRLCFSPSPPIDLFWYIA